MDCKIDSKIKPIVLILFAAFFITGCASYGSRTYSLITPETRSYASDNDRVKVSISSNAWNGNPLVTRQGREVYEEIEPDTVFSLPLLDREAMAAAEEPPFSFVEFLEGRYTHVPPALRLRLRSFLSEVFGQFQRRDLSLDLGSLKKMGLI